MTVEKITALAASGESETLEFKETTGTHREATRTVCAFLNQRGGRVLFGVTQAGAVVGQQASERIIEELSAEFQKIEPPAFPTIERVRVSGNLEVILVDAGPGIPKPYTYQGKAYRRVGNTTLAMSSDEYNRVLLERMHKEHRWENQLADGWSINDLDAAEIRRTAAEAVRSGRLEEPASRELPDLLLGLELLRDGAPLRAAAVLFGVKKRLAMDMPQCLLRVARFRGFDKMKFLDNRQFSGNAFTLLSHAERFLRDTLPIAARFEPHRFARIDEPLYPPLATREAIANALCHRDYLMGSGSIGVAVYDDRLEITSPGSLHFGLTPEKLFHPHESKPWNPLIADAFYRRGIIEEWGGGTLKMAAITKAARLPMPEIEEDGGCVTVRFRHGQFVPQRRIGESSPAERCREVLAMLDGTKDGLTRREIHACLGYGVSERQVRRALDELRDKKLIVSTKRGPLTRWQRQKQKA